MMLASCLQRFGRAREGPSESGSRDEQDAKRAKFLFCFLCVSGARLGFGAPEGAGTYYRTRLAYEKTPREEGRGVRVFGLPIVQEERR